MYKITYVHRGDTTENMLFVPGDNDYTISAGTLNIGCGISGELSITLPPTNPARSDLVCLSDEVIFYRDGVELWRGRPVTSEIDFYMNGDLTCEGILSYLYDTYFPPYDFSGSPKDLISEVLDNHNEQVEDSKKIYLGEVTVEDSNDYIARSSTDYTRSLEVLTEKLVNESLGGYLRVRMEDGVRYLDYLSSYGTTATQAIEFGVNLLDLADTVEYSDTITALLPLGAQDEETGEYLTIESVNDGSKYIYDAEAVATFGWICGCATWEDVTVAANLLSKAEDYLAQSTSGIRSLEVKAIDLILAGEDVDAINLGDAVKITSDPHGIDEYIELTELKINILKPASSTMTFGSQGASYTGSAKTTERQVLSSISKTYTTIRNLSSQYVKTEYLEASYITAADIDAKYATIETLETNYITAASIEAKYATITTLEASYATITSLNAVSATVSTLSADLANINTILSGAIGTGTLQTIHLTASNTMIDSAVINDAAIASLSASKLTAGTIYTSQIKIQSAEDDESLYISGSLMQFSDDSIIRMQLGKDAEGEFNIYICDPDGNIIWDALGLTEAGLTGNGAIIKDAAIADNANINESKIDMQSVAERLNKDGSITVDYANVIVNDTTLDYALTTITSSTEAAATAAQEAQAAADAAQETADDAQEAADAAKEAAANAQTYAEEVQRDAASALSDYAASVTTTLDSLQSQIDGQIETWYYDYAPSLTNLPASDWTTDDEKEAHVGDLFFDKSTGYSYRFFNNDGTYEWTLIQDTDITTALSAASTAQDTADAKRRVFTSTPAPPYDVGDLWTDGTDIKTCTTARKSGATYVSSDWVVLNAYANQDAVDAAQAAADEAQAAADAAQSAADDAQAAADAVTSRVTTLETEMTVVQGQITSKVWQTDIDSAVSDLESEITTIQDQYTTVSQTVSGLISQVGDIETTVSDNYKSLSSKITTVETTASGIQSTVSELQTTVSSNYSTLSSRITTVEETSDSLSASISSVQTQLNSLSVGGRNLILDSEEIFVTRSDTTYSYIREKIPFMANSDYGITQLADGGEFTLSFDYEITGVTTACNVYLGLKYTSTSYTQGNISTFALAVGDNTGHYSCTFTPTTAQMQYGVAWLFNGFGAGSNADIVVTLQHIKFEKGNVATDWTPAPEDVDEELETINESYVALVIAVGGITSDVSTINTILIGDDDTTGLADLINDNSTTIDDLVAALSDSDGNYISAESLQSQIEQLPEEIAITISSSLASYEATQEGILTTLDEYATYFSFTTDGLRISDSDSDFALLLSSDRVSFLESDSEVAYISDSMLYIYDADILNSLQLGNFKWMPRESGNLSLVKVGDD